MRKIPPLIREHFLVILFLLFYAAALSYKLISSPTPFYDWDESLYVQTGKEMFERKFFLFPVWQGQVWLDKPPLVPSLYGAVMKLFAFAPPEITTRLFTLAVAITVLIFSYIFFLRALGDKLTAVLATAVTAFTPIFLQRAQVVNLDVFLLLGWLGYLIFFQRFWIGMVFLMIAVLSKSLIGFYPIVIMGLFHLYLRLTKKIDAKQLRTVLVKLGTQTAIAAVWFLLMLVLYKEPFFRQHIIESHFRRVSSSIEFHFGRRTYYLELAAEQFGILAALAVIGLIWELIKWRQAKLTGFRLLYSLYLMPWFLFLNLTKTKIFWYFYPVIPQFAFLTAAALQFLRRRKVFYYLAFYIVVAQLVYLNFVKTNYLKKSYADFEPHYELAQYAKNNCGRLYVLENAQTREAFATLERLGLMITTTKWWGSHPSIVYYFGKKTDFIYDVETFAKISSSLEKEECAAVSEKYDQGSLKTLKRFAPYTLLKADR